MPRGIRAMRREESARRRELRRREREEARMAQLAEDAAEEAFFLDYLFA